MKNTAINFEKREKSLAKKMRDKQKFAKRQSSKHNSIKYASIVFQALLVMEDNKND